MSEKEVGVIHHLLEVEQIASSMTFQARSDADKKIAGAKAEADAQFKSSLKEIIEKNERLYAEKTAELNDRKSDDLEHYKMEISASRQDRSAFFSFLDSVLLTE